MGIFGVLPPGSCAPVNPPPGYTPQPHRQPTERPERRRNTPTRPQHKNAVQRPTERRTAYTQTTAPTTPQTEPQYRTRAAIQDYILQQPGRGSRPQGSPNGDPQTAPQRAGTPPGCNGVAPQTETPTAAHRRHRGQKKTPRAEARSVAPSIYSFSTGQRRPRTERLKCKVISIFSPPY